MVKINPIKATQSKITVKKAVRKFKKVKIDISTEEFGYFLVDR